jgi:hypothetical protein
MEFLHTYSQGGLTSGRRDDIPNAIETETQIWNFYIHITKEG